MSFDLGIYANIPFPAYSKSWTFISVSGFFCPVWKGCYLDNLTNFFVSLMINAWSTIDHETNINIGLISLHWSRGWRWREAVGEYEMCDSFNLLPSIHPESSQWVIGDVGLSEYIQPSLASELTKNHESIIQWHVHIIWWLRCTEVRQLLESLFG